RPLAPRDYEGPIRLFDRHLYEKGGLVLHMLRRMLGDELFWRGVNAYLTKHAGSIVETGGLMRAPEDRWRGAASSSSSSSGSTAPGTPSSRSRSSTSTAR